MSRKDLHTRTRALARTRHTDSSDVQRNPFSVSRENTNQSISCGAITSMFQPDLSTKNALHSPSNTWYIRWAHLPVLCCAAQLTKIVGAPALDAATGRNDTCTSCAQGNGGGGDA